MDTFLSNIYEKSELYLLFLTMATNTMNEKNVCMA
jgi:hypothetical protein